GLQLADSKTNSLKYQFTNYHRADGFNGVRNALYHVQDAKGWRFNNFIILSDVNSISDKGYFLRPTMDITKKFAKLRNYSVKTTNSVEDNEIREKLTDSLSSQSFAFQTFQVAMLSDEGKANHWSLTYFTRADEYPIGKDLVKADRSQNLNFTVE